ncbi:phosphatase PAP2 family protein [Mucilaginibacter sp.]|uniref:phosphatase PAP2 family protein n=1 Tax=Mucilaginibacter sp. TaxID=1882438 RepID=UPI0026136269|nr:phosphatase PAP2 family protein [Mucilaginibacter sp.]MDB4922943.1 hypothetical protein [Mucilaginibacter sp.]
MVKSIFLPVRYKILTISIMSLLATVLSCQCFAQQLNDTTKRIKVIDTLKKDLFTAPDTVRHLHSKLWTLLPPSIMIAYGTSSFYFHPVRRIDKSIYNETLKHDWVPNSHMEDYFQFAPVILTYGLNLAGIHGKNTFVDRSMTYLLAQGMTELTVFSLKKATHRARPNGSNSYSFPSGHTANAFAGAEFMAQELGEKSPFYSAIGYAFAATTGVFRIYHKDHWFSDVVAGAGFGILSTKGAYLLYPVIRNSLTPKGREKERSSTGIDIKQKPKKEKILLPSFNDGTIGLQFAMQL